MADESTPRKRRSRAGSQPLDIPQQRRRSGTRQRAREQAAEASAQALTAVPVGPEPVRPMAREERIARRAYELYEARGGTNGDDMRDWLEAERQIDAELSAGHEPREG